MWKNGRISVSLRGSSFAKAHLFLCWRPLRFVFFFTQKTPWMKKEKKHFFFLSSLRCCSSLSLAPDKTAIFFSPLSLAARDKQQTQRDGIITIRIDRRDEASSDIAWHFSIIQEQEKRKRRKEKTKDVNINVRFGLAIYTWMWREDGMPSTCGTGIESLTRIPSCIGYVSSSSSIRSLLNPPPI